MLNTKTSFPYLSQWPWTCRSRCRRHCWPCIGNLLHQSLRLRRPPDRLSHQWMWSWCVHSTSAPSCPSSIGWSWEETRWRDIWGLVSHPQLRSLAPVGHRILVAGSFLQARWERRRIATEVFKHQTLSLYYLAQTQYYLGCESPKNECLQVHVTMLRLNLLMVQSKFPELLRGKLNAFETNSERQTHWSEFRVSLIQTTKTPNGVEKYMWEPAGLGLQVFFQVH